MKVFEPCLFEEYYIPQKQIDLSSAEQMFLLAACRNDISLIGGIIQENCYVDTPYKRFEGKDGIEEFVSSFLARFEADTAAVKPYFQTGNDTCCVSESVVEFENSGKIWQVPMFVCADLKEGKLNGIRIYFKYYYLKDLTPYRKPIFRSGTMELTDPDLFPYPVSEYYMALHKQGGTDVKKMDELISEDCVYGGYEKDKGRRYNKKDILSEYRAMADYIPHLVSMKAENVVSNDGVCVMEWTHLISDEGRRRLERPAMAGVAAYQYKDGKLVSIRICDYAGHE
ncbi:MAG: nuclear transport factor 2 family protein, partial [Erysipelotrichaceae bacterium]|nr:nuclear transport factor 2 family protein [Erysipelotrichaceae bacterium]